MKKNLKPKRQPFDRVRIVKKHLTRLSYEQLIDIESALKILQTNALTVRYADRRILDNLKMWAWPTMAFAKRVDNIVNNPRVVKFRRYQKI